MKLGSRSYTKPYEGKRSENEIYLEVLKNVQSSAEMLGEYSL